MYAASVFFEVVDSWAESIQVQGKIPGFVPAKIAVTRRSVQDRKNLKFYFVIGIFAKYPKLDYEDVKLMLEHPKALLHPGTMSEMSAVHPSLR